VIGFGCGLSTVLVPLYLSEIAPASMKKSLGIANQFFIVVGILIGQSLSLPLGQPMKWRWVFTVAMGIAVVQLVGSFFVPAKSGSEEREEEDETEEGRPLLPRDNEGEGAMCIRELVMSKDSVVRRGCESLLRTFYSRGVDKLTG
jgi:MFS family permease